VQWVVLSELCLVELHVQESAEFLHYQEFKTALDVSIIQLDGDSLSSKRRQSVLSLSGLMNKLSRGIAVNLEVPERQRRNS
jgi:hypothetical protein